MIELRVNGKDMTAVEGVTVAGFLRELGHDPRLVAVEHNGEILKRALLETTALEPGDRLEVVRFVQGG